MLEALRPSPFTSAFEKAFRYDLGTQETFKALPHSEELGLVMYLDRQTMFRNFFNESDVLQSQGTF